MGKDKQPKHRQAARDLKRRAAVRQPYERLLIVCEGAQTEPQYLREIQQTYRLATAHVHVLHSQIGTEPQQVLEYALTVLPSYEKGSGGHWAAVFDRVDVATQRAQRLAKATTAHDGTQPYTGMHELVSRLMHLKD